MTARKPKPHSETAFVPMNDGRHQHDKRPWFHLLAASPTARMARRRMSDDDKDEWKLFLADGWRIVKVRVTVMTPGQIKAEKGTRR